MRLRKLEELTTKIVDEMPIEYDIETDWLYNQRIQKGEKTGEKRGEIRGAKSAFANVLLVIDLI